jgi:hypothetical protein
MITIVYWVYNFIYVKNQFLYGKFAFGQEENNLIDIE